MATTSATAAVIQAVEHVVIEEATTIVKAITTQNAAEIKTIVNGVAKEGAAATDDSISTIIENIEDGAKVIGRELVEGAEAVIEAVEKHPELIAEGALAVGIGIASIVQPELIVGSVALIGKMAADATKTTIKEIVVESSTGVVKGVSAEIAEETAELAAEDAAAKAKVVALEAAKDGSKPGQDATVEVKATGTVTTEVVPSDEKKKGEVSGESLVTTVSGDATAVVTGVPSQSNDGNPEVLSTATIQTSATATGKIEADSNVVLVEGPAVVATNDLTGAKTAIQEGSKTVNVETSASTEVTTIQSKAPVVAAVDVKELAKEVAREMVEIETAKTEQTERKTAESTETGSLDASLKSSTARLEATQENSLHPVNQEASEIINDLDEVKTEPVGHEIPVASTSGLETTGKIEEIPQVTKTVEEGAGPVEPKLEPPAAITTPEDGSHAITHAAVLSAHEKIATLHESNQVLHKSNEILHQKLDTMQEALVAITKALAERAPVPVAQAAIEPEPQATEYNQIVLATSPEVVKQQLGIFGNIGWLFGVGKGGSSKHKRGKSIATSTPASVPGGGSV